MESLIIHMYTSICFEIMLSGRGKLPRRLRPVFVARGRRRAQIDEHCV
jgi:hypothetical protein